MMAALLGGHVQFSIEGLSAAVAARACRQLARVRGHRRATLAQPARGADHRRGRRAGLRIRRLDRVGRAGGHADSDRRAAVHRDRPHRGTPEARQWFGVSGSDAGLLPPPAFAEFIRVEHTPLRQADPRRRAARRVKRAHMDSTASRRRQHAGLLELINASWTTQAIRTACVLRVPELLAGSRERSRPLVAADARLPMPRRSNACCAHWPRWALCSDRRTTAATR